MERLEDRCLLSLTTPPLELADESEGASEPVFTFSLSDDGSVGGLSAVANEDIIAYDGTDYSIVFDGSNVGVESLEIAAMAIMDDDTILMTFTAPAVFPGIGRIDDSDILMFTATSLGENTTAGSFSLYFDGSQFDLTTGDENIDALELLDDGRIVISTVGLYGVGDLTGGGEDLIAFTPALPGATVTDGAWSMYFDGSDVGLAGENIDAMTVNPEGDILLSTINAFVLPNLSARDEDVSSFTPTSLGSDTVGVFDPVLFFDGSDHGLVVNDIHSIDVSSPNQSPVAEVNGPYAGEVNSQIAFDSAGSTDPDGIIVSRVWDFGDGTRDTGPTPSHAYTAGGEYIVTLAVTDDQGGIDIATATVTIEEDLPVFTFSLSDDGSVGGLSAVANEDIIASDGTDFSILFDGSNVGLESLEFAAMAIMDDDTILMTFTAPAVFPGIGRIDDSDILMFTATSLGENTTAGSFSLYFDGSQFDLTTGDENIDALELLDDGRIVISTVGLFTVGDLTGGGEDLIAFTPTSPGATVTDGAWSMYFDGSDVGLTGENIDAMTVNPEGEILLSTINAFVLPNLSARDEDVSSFTPTSLGSDTAGVFDPTLFLDGSDHGMTVNDIHSLDVSPPNQSPVAEVNGPYAGEVNSQIAFDSAGSTDPDGIIVSRVWDFGDGTRVTGPTPSHTYTAGGEYTVTLAVTDDQGGIDIATAAVTINEDLPVLAFSLEDDGSVGGLSAVANEDVITYDGTDFSILFDGSDVGLESLKIAAMAIVDDDTILMTFTLPADFPGIGRVDDSDVVMFTATSLGENTTAGSFSLYFDGSQFDLTTGDENIDALALLDDGRLVISTVGLYSVGDLTGGGEDLIAFTPTSPGAPVTDGDWSLYFDGSDVGLAAENIDATTVGPNGEILFSTAGAFRLPELSIHDEDVFSFDPLSLGSDTMGVFAPTLLFDGSVHGLALNDVRSISLITSRDVDSLDFLELTDLDLSAGEVVYEFTAANDGYLTVDATFDPAAGAVELELLDATETPIGTLATENGYLRIDHAGATGGNVYTFRLSGTNTDVDLRLVNLVDHAGTTVTVHGTDGDDTFSFAPTGSYAVSINGVAYHFDKAQVDNLHFDGGAGSDAAVVTGSINAETVDLHPGSLTSTDSLSGFRLTVDHSETITVNSGGGTDVVSFFDSTGDDTLTAAPTQFRLTGTPVGGDAFTLTANNFAYAHAYAKSDGHDTADFTGSDANDQLKIYPDYLKLSGAGFYNRAKFFESYTADGQGGTGDVALVYGSEATDVLWATKNELRMDFAAVLLPDERAPFENPAYDVLANAFEIVRAYAEGDPADWVELHGSTTSDVLIAKPHKVEMMNGPRKADGVLRGDEYKITARGFRNVVAVGDADDVAKLYDSANPGIDIWAVDYRDGQTWSTMSTPDRLLYEVLAFGRVGGYGFNGGLGEDHGENRKDHADLVDFVFQYGYWEE